MRSLNYDCGGTKGSGPSGLSTFRRTREGSGDDEVRVVDGFRAYHRVDEDVDDYVSLPSRRYAEAVQAARHSAPPGFLRALKAPGHFTGDERATSRETLNG